jgi:hypothetical protein
MIKLTKYTFSRKFQCAVRDTENYDNFDTDEKDQPLKTGNGMTKSKFFPDFPPCVKLWVGSACGSASKWKFEFGSGLASTRC